MPADDKEDCKKNHKAETGRRIEMLKGQIDKEYLLLGKRVVELSEAAKHDIDGLVDELITMKCLLKKDEDETP